MHPLIGYAYALAAPPVAMGSRETSQVPTKYVHTSMGARTPRACSLSHHIDNEHVAFNQSESLGNPDNNTFDA
ncbi:MAG: hypothetical protein OXU68_09950 [Bacteroidota bacterium]|nr:hypothetical protein [Bacteroidota bacterium]